MTSAPVRIALVLRQPRRLVERHAALGDGDRIRIRFLGTAAGRGGEHRDREEVRVQAHALGCG
jgi:hypothetical protein